MAANCTSGWSFPWGVRVRLAERLLLAMFDSLDEAQYVEEWGELEGLLRQELWPALGVSDAVHHSCFAWLHFRWGAGGAGLLWLLVLQGMPCCGAGTAVLGLRFLLGLLGLLAC